MDYITRNVSINLRRIRKAKKMSLDEVAEETGVSKSMLGQIERGESNPTVATLGKIVSGLRVSFNELVSIPKVENYIVRKSSLTPMKESNDEYTVYSYFPYEDDRNFEIYSVEIRPGGKYHCVSHGENTYEYINVVSGTLFMEVGEEGSIVEAGDAIRISTDKDHCYINNGHDLLCFTIVFQWK